LRNATARQARENEIRQQFKMQAIGRFAAGIAHDFNNLLLIILGYTEEMLATAGPGHSDSHALNEIKQAGERATGITQQLLQFSRNEPIERRDIDLNELIGEAEPNLHRLAGSSVRLQFRLDQNLGAVRADGGQLNQVLTNLVANARDAMPGGGTIAIETVNVERPRAGYPANVKEAFVGLNVSDTGTGMNAETAGQIFEPFFTTRKRGGGTGLGLSIVHSIVTDLGGTIHVDSEPGKGATFTIYLPAVEKPTGADIADNVPVSREASA
jgi:signal transduction histidine kinase